jgi:hypothetical protein
MGTCSRLCHLRKKASRASDESSLAKYASKARVHDPRHRNFPPGDLLMARQHVVSLIERRARKRGCSWIDDSSRRDGGTRSFIETLGDDGRFSRLVRDAIRNETTEMDRRGDMLLSKRAVHDFVGGLRDRVRTLIERLVPGSGRKHLTAITRLAEKIIASTEIDDEFDFVTSMILSSGSHHRYNGTMGWPSDPRGGQSQPYRFEPAASVPSPYVKSMLAKAATNRLHIIRLLEQLTIASKAGVVDFLQRNRGTMDPMTTQDVVFFYEELVHAVERVRKTLIEILRKRCAAWQGDAASAGEPHFRTWQEAVTTLGRNECTRYKEEAARLDGVVEEAVDMIGQVISLTPRDTRLKNLHTQLIGMRGNKLAPHRSRGAPTVS